jgi:hypothetical protein
MVAAR